MAISEFNKLEDVWWEGLSLGGLSFGVPYMHSMSSRRWARYVHEVKGHAYCSTHSSFVLTCDL